jgi:hypothetical protein
MAPKSGPVRDVSLPEDDAVIAELGARLSLRDEAAARRRFDQLSRALREADEEAARAADDEDDAYASLRIALLERWPVLDDPWHPDFAATVRDHRDAIRAFLRNEAPARQFRAAGDRLARARDRSDGLRQAFAPVRRLVRTYETRTLAGRLHFVGGPAWNYYQALLDCERGVP